MTENQTQALENTGTRYGDHRNSFVDSLLCLAMDIGEQLLKSGAEISRVEDTVERICHAYGAAHVEVFAIISYINAAIRMPDGSYSSQIRRVRQSNNDFYKIELFNAISREVCITRPPLDELNAKIVAAKKKKPFPECLDYFAYSIASGGFAIFFGGSLLDGLAAALIGALIALVLKIINKTSNNLNSLAKTFISAFVGGVFSCLAPKIGFGHSEGMIMIGTIMLTIPGVSFGTALRDLFCGDILAGALKTIQAVLATFMIALAYFLAFSLIGG